MTQSGKPPRIHPYAGKPQSAREEHNDLPILTIEERIERARRSYTAWVARQRAHVEHPAPRTTHR